MRTFKTLEPRPNELPPVEITYEGFDRNAINAEFIALVYIEGEIDTYVLDNEKKAMESLIDYLQDRYICDFKIIGVFRKIK